MGDKAEARRTMKAAGLDTIPGTEGVIASADEALRAAADVGYPVLLKATAGGGGRGMRRCADESQLQRSFAEASLEAEKAFGNSGLYLERALEGARHVEFQILADHFGSAVHLGERECSVQRRHQKLLEEAPSPAVDATQRALAGELAAEAAVAIGYASAGTVEFLRADDGSLYFMEMNTRLQVEHPVTEATTGIDLVKMQLALASGHRLEGEAPPTVGHAIEVRLNAEDPDRQFAPAPGTVELFRLPTGPGLRVDTGVSQGDVVAPEFDSMIAKMIAYGKNRHSEAYPPRYPPGAGNSRTERDGTGLFKRPQVAENRTESDALG